MSIGATRRDADMSTVNRRLVIAAIILIIATIICTYVVEIWNIRSVLNLSWMIGFPVVAGLYIGKNLKEKVIFALFFLFVTLATSVGFVFAYWGDY
jgi:hypothetical protein